MAEHPEKEEAAVETGGIMKIDCYISQGCGSEEALKENIARALEAEKIDAEVGIHRLSS